MEWSIFTVISKICMKYILLLSTFYIQVLNLNAQKADTNYIHSAVESRFNLKLDTMNYCELYILNGVPFEKEDFANELENYKRSEVKFTTIADLTNTTWFHRECDFMILVGAGDYKQPKEKKIKELDSIRTNLNENLPELIIRDYICKLCKQVIIDGMPIEMYKARTLVNELKPKNIDFIVSYESANPAIFGRNAVNGITEIFLK